MATPTYDPIASTTLALPALSVTFSSLDTIAAGYRDLVLVIGGIQPSNGGPYWRANGDSGVNYNYVRMYGDGTSAFSQSGTSNSGTLGYMGTDFSMVIHFQDFSQTDKHKSTIVRSDGSTTGTNALAHRWASTAAITSILIGGNFSAGSVFSLYGIAA